MPNSYKAPFTIVNGYPKKAGTDFYLKLDSELIASPTELAQAETGLEHLRC